MAGSSLDQYQKTLLKNSKDVKMLLKKLVVNVRGLISYKQLYGTTWNTFGYKGSSMWAYSYSPNTGTIEVHTTYFGIPSQLQSYNEKHTKLYWNARYKDLTEDEKLESSWVEVKRQLNF